MLSWPGLINFTAFEGYWWSIHKQGRTINTVAGCIPQQEFGEVPTPGHTKGNLIIPYSSVRTTGKLLSSVPSAQPLSLYSRRNDLCYTKTQKSQEVVLIHSVWYLCYPAQWEPVTDLVELTDATACFWAAHTEDYLPAISAQMHQQLLIGSSLVRAVLSKHPLASGLNLFWFHTLLMDLLLQTTDFY